MTKNERKNYNTHNWFDLGELAICQKCGHSLVSLGEWKNVGTVIIPNGLDFTCDEIIKSGRINKSGFKFIKYKKQFNEKG